MVSPKIQPVDKGYSVEHLNEKQRIFCHEYLKEFNATEAARIAGYKHPNVAGAKLLANKRVAGYLGKKLRDRINKIDLEADDVIRELMYIGFSDPRTLFANGVMQDIADMSEAVARSISSFKVKQFTDEEGRTTTTAEVKFWNKPQALELLAKHLGILKDNGMNVGVNVNVGLLGEVLKRVENQRKVIDANYIEERTNGKPVDSEEEDD